MKNWLTVVIPCKNEGELLIETIRSIGEDVNIVVADSSTDSTPDLLRSEFPEVFLVPGGLPAQARNNGANMVQTPYTLFLDADMDISKINLSGIVSDMIKNDLDLVTCRIAVRGKYGLLYYAFYLVQNIISLLTPFAVGGFMLFRTESFSQCGGFDSRDKFAEDYHLSMKISPDRFKIYHSPAYTSDRRLRNKSAWYMIKQMTLCWFNRNNPDFYQKDYGYWQ